MLASLNFHKKKIVAHKRKFMRQKTLERVGSKRGNNVIKSRILEHDFHQFPLRDLTFLEGLEDLEDLEELEVLRSFGVVS